VGRPGDPGVLMGVCGAVAAWFCSPLRMYASNSGRNRCIAEAIGETADGPRGRWWSAWAARRCRG